MAPERRRAGRRKQARPDTQVLIRGFDPALSVGSARPAVFRSSTYVFRSPEHAERAFLVAQGKIQREPGEDVDLIYSRFNHPNAEILEDQVIPLEPGARAAAVFNSGMSAIATACFALLRPGMAIAYTEPIYGGTHHLVHRLLEPYGIRAVPMMAGDGKAIRKAILGTRGLGLVLVETPANPTLVMTDIAAAAAAAADRKGPRVPVAVDNTFLGPVFQHPLALGADLSIYSATKYLAGFSDMIGGVVLGRDAETIRAVKSMRSMIGTILQPDECWILGSRLPTVSLRMNRQSKSAERIVGALRGHRALERVVYPTCFEDREQRRIYESQCSFPGAVFTLEFRGGKAAAFEFLRRLRVIRSAVSLGGVESLACHPATTTQSSMPKEDLARFGIGPGMVRVSVGVEDWRDLAEDCREALAAIP